MGLFKKNKKEKDTETPSSPESGLSKKEARNRRKALKILPIEAEEATNPKIALYNEIVRHAYCYSEEEISTNLSYEEKRSVFFCAKSDYPELFWLDSFMYTPNTLSLKFRCLNKDGNLDIKEIERKKRELQSAANFFTRGITKKTKPYDAFITIYRRLILNLDYDGIGLGIEEKTGGENSYADLSREDTLRSLYSALVERKVVCAGYAVALQYLLQKVGISSAYVVSEVAGSMAHAFVALKIGRFCYYADPTWDDSSNTVREGENNDIIKYNYCCVPYREFMMTAPESRPLHTPNHEYFPFWEKFESVQHEYFRRKNGYFTHYDEDKFVNMIANDIIEYNEKEMGKFVVSFRCPDEVTCSMITSKLMQNFASIKTKVLEKIGKKSNKSLNKAKKLLECSSYSYYPNCCVQYLQLVK